MTDSSSSADALLTEHLRYTPLSLIDDIINTVNAIVYRAIQAIENGLLSTPPQALGFGTDSSSTDLSIRDADGEGNVEYPEARMEIENGVHQLETLLEATVDKTFDKFEIYTLRNILTVPEDLAPWMRLGHYENLTFPIPSNAPTTESILNLRRKLQETQKLNLALRTEHARTAALLSQVKSLLLAPSTSTTTTKTEDADQEGTTAPNTSPPLPPSTNANFSFLTTTPSAQALNLTFLPPLTSPHSSSSSTPLTTTTAFTTSQLPSLRSLLSSLRPKLSTLPGGSDSKLTIAHETAREHERREYLEGRVRRVLGREVGRLADGDVDMEMDMDMDVVGNGEKRTVEEVSALEDLVGGGRDVGMGG